MLNPIVEAYHRAALINRSDIFPDTVLTPCTQLRDAATAAPGWVGKNWKPGGTLLMGINPGGGGDAYRLNSTDQQLYGLIRAFKAAHADQSEEALHALSESWIGIQATHNIYRVIHKILDAINADCDDMAFLNILPFRTRNDAAASSVILRQAWTSATSHQVAALKPRRIIALGRKAFDALNAVGATGSYEVICLKRSRGDSYITPEAQAVLAMLRIDR